jgi:dGTPase
VIPLSKIDFVHTFDAQFRSFGSGTFFRTFGWKENNEKYPYLKEVHGFHMNDFGAIVAAASLAHDIGNPPLDIQVKSDRGVFSIGNGKYQDKLSKSNGRI